jgi:transcriptional regulator with XRE-family HTH domain
MPGDYDRALGAAVRELRTTRGLTQERLAGKADMTLGTIARLELARADPNWPTVRAVIKALDASWTEFGEALDAAERIAKASDGEH